jgi:phosphate-selective porin OprO and OprP
VRDFVLFVALLVAPPEPEPAEPEEPEEPEEHNEDEPDARAVLRIVSEFVQPTLLFETDYRHHVDDAYGPNGFSLARARLGLRLTPTPWMTAVGTVEFAEQEQILLLDAYAQLDATDWLELTVGLSKPPLFASFRHEEIATLAMPSRSAVVNEMRIRRDAGVEARFKPRAAPLEAIVRLGNGSMELMGEGALTPTGYANLDLVLGRAWAGGESELLGLRFGIAGMVDQTRERESIAGATPLEFVYAQPVPTRGLRARATSHAIVYVGPVRLLVEGGFAHERRDHDEPTHARAPVQSWGLTGEVSWTIRGAWREVGTRPEVARLNDGPWDRGALELSARVDRLWLGRGAPELLDSGGTTAALGFRWWPTAFLGLTIYGDATRFDVAPIEAPARLWGGTFLLRASFFWD